MTGLHVPPKLEHAQAAPAVPVKKIKAPVEQKPVEEPPKAVEQPPVPILSGPEQLMQAVGIPQHEWPYANQVIMGEGGWDGATQWNTQGSGAYGICQSLPAGKMAVAGPDWQTNPLTQLIWCNDYAIKRYGTWAYAAQWKQCIGACYNAHTGLTSYKDHTWW